VSASEEYSPSAEPGAVLTQTPGGGDEAYHRSPVLLTVATRSEPPPSPGTGVPDVVGMPREDAVQRIEDAGYVAEVVVEWKCEPGSPDCDAIPDRVWTQTPTAGEALEGGATVTIWVNPTA
jgi:beta-lactam-binding protein with PASTA domain